jgi:hypothetical protein
MAILMIVAYGIVPNVTASGAMAIGALAYLAYSLFSRRILAKHHRLGIRAFREGHFGAAIGHYNQSIEFFERYPWIDRFRAVTMMSPSDAPDAILVPKPARGKPRRLVPL